MSSYIDDETLARLKNRDSQLLVAIFKEVNPYLSRVCIANGIYKENAEEIIHSAWEKFFSNLDKFEGRSQIKTFVCGILFNKIHEYRRAQKKTEFEDDSEKIMDQTFTRDGWWKTPPRSPHRILELQQAAEFIRECLEGLTEQQKAAFVMREVEEENSNDICNVLGIEVSHLRVLLFRAKDKLRKCLDGRIDSGTGT